MKELIKIDSYSFRQRLSHYLSEVEYGNKEIIVKRRNKPSVKIIAVIDDKKENE
jgi:prevent-host-death family protein